MQAVILAAGRGSRLGKHEYPKALTCLSDRESILDRQIASLKEYLPSSAITIVVGYRKELIMEKFPGYHFVINDDYASENTAKSLLRALSSIPKDDILWMNGDVVFHPSVLEVLFRHGPTAMVVNQGKVGEEEVKYRLNSIGMISEISKEVEGAVGESVGINLFKEKDAIELIQALQNCALMDYFEKGIEQCIQRGMQIKPAVIKHDYCVEIDFPEDLERAKKLAHHWKKRS